ncbi:MAG: ATPase P [Desulfovibrio sp.]
MLNYTIGSHKNLHITHIVLDYNGTIAFDGNPIAGVFPLVEALAKNVKVCVLTADTYGTVAQALEDWPVEVVVLDAAANEDEGIAKLEFVNSLGDGVVALGNGQNDRLMLKNACVGIAVCGREGLACAALLAADVCVVSIVDGLELLLHSNRLSATLRT